MAGVKILVGDDDGGEDVGVGTFIGDYPDFKAILKQHGLGSMFESVMETIASTIGEMIMTTIWTFPIVMLTAVDLSYAELLDTTDKLHEERLIEQPHLAVAHPSLVSTLHEALVAQSMLETLEYVLNRQRDMLGKAGLQKHHRKRYANM